MFQPRHRIVVFALPADEKADSAFQRFQRSFARRRIYPAQKPGQIAVKRLPCKNLVDNKRQQRQFGQFVVAPDNRLRRFALTTRIAAANIAPACRRGQVAHPVDNALAACRSSRPRKRIPNRRHRSSSRHRKRIPNRRHRSRSRLRRHRRTAVFRRCRISRRRPGSPGCPVHQLENQRRAPYITNKPFHKILLLI